MPKGRVTARGLLRLWRLLRQQPYSAVQTWMYHADVIGGVCARLAGQRQLLWNVRNSTLQVGASSRMTMWLVKVCALLSAWVPRTIVSCAQQATQVHVQQGYCARKFVHIPNGFDLQRFEHDTQGRQQLRADWGVPTDAVVLGMVGRFDPQKDHHMLLRAFAQVHSQHPQTLLVLAGRGLDAQNDALSAWIQDLGLQEAVRLLGPRTDVPKVMSALDVHVLSSRYGEAFPNVLAEAMACRTPCITTDVGDASSVVSHTGWVVPPQDEPAMVQAMLGAVDELNHSPTRWEQRRQSCRSRVMAEFDLATMVKRYHQAWFNPQLTSAT
jgi:glycosyltransferase involved in cell wall biosynthesis